MSEMSVEEVTRIREVMKRWKYVHEHTPNTTPSCQVRIPHTRYGTLDRRHRGRTQDLIGYGKTVEEAFLVAYEQYKKQKGQHEA